MQPTIRVPVLRHQSPVFPESRNTFVSLEWCFKAPFPSPPLGMRLSSTALCEDPSPEYSPITPYSASLGTLDLQSHRIASPSFLLNCCICRFISELRLEWKATKCYKVETEAGGNTLLSCCTVPFSWESCHGASTMKSSPDTESFGEECQRKILVSVLARALPMNPLSNLCYQLYPCESGG